MVIRAGEREPLRVDLACGRTKKEGFIGIDKQKIEGVEYAQDLMMFPWPFMDESVSEFYCSHYVEHIPIQLSSGAYGLHKFMEEVWRCLIPGGTITIKTPYYASEQAFQDPTHCRGMTDLSFIYYNQAAVGGLLGHYMACCNFSEVSKTKFINAEFEGMEQKELERRIKYHINVVQEIQYVLKKEPLISS